MAEDIIIFDAARVPFVRGVSLVEASAGTGKTYAIGMLVLRGVVELNIPIDKILIVTFTKAATEELKSRIRSRLAEARELLQQRLDAALPVENGDVDATLLDWLSTLTDHTQAIQRLQLALYDIDNASIYTIHSFCQKMLVEQALESGQLFTVELVANIDHIISQVVDDFWRNEIYCLAPLPCGILTAAFETPEKLFESVSETYRSVAEIEPEGEAVDRATATFEEKMKVLQVWWQKNKSELYAQFSKAIPNKHFKKYLVDNFDSWFASISAFLDGSSYLVPEKIELLIYENLFDELNGTTFRGDEKKDNYLSQWSLPSTEVREFCDARDALLLSFRCKLAQLRGEVSARLLKQGTMGFDGLIQNLAAGLAGDKGGQLARVIGERFSLALIDEFQDTDDLQYKIFSKLFGTGKHYLYLIGDPKQAIYKFRGADIYSYFKARKSADKRLTLEKNYRSHPLLLKEVNRLFETRQRPFLYEETVLDYHRVQPGLTSSSFDIIENGQSLGGMVYCTLEQNSDDKKGRWSSGKAAERFRRYTVAEISRLLRPDRIRCQTKDGESELLPRNIAILVRSHKQAEEYQESLIEGGIPAVVNSKKSVFQTEECRELIILLKAIASPTEPAKLKAAMTISWFQLTGNMLVDIWDDEDERSSRQAKMIFYHGMWQDQGLFSMMNAFLLAEKIFFNIAATKYAERTIANINQLIELIQEEESTENYGMGQLLQWLQRVYLQENTLAGAELLLESDEDAVQIVTMHGAKGLEYPVVFCPYLWYSSSRMSQEKHQVSVHENGRNMIDLGSVYFEERRQLAVSDQKAEELRLLYVALTRAKVRCYTMWGDVKKHNPVADSFDSALGYLLFPDGPCDSKTQTSVFDSLAEAASILHHQIEKVQSAEKYKTEAEETEFGALVPSGRSLYTDWQLTSFSGLAKLSDYEYERGSTTVSVLAENPIAVEGLPAGPSFGNAIHDLLEGVDFASFLETSPELRLQIERKCERYGVNAKAEDIEKLLRCVVSSSLPRDFRLMDIPSERCLKEMPFYFQLSLFQTEAMSEILHNDPTVLGVGSRQMRGYLTGFVDLVCLHEGKYYIMDYKTNHLGKDRLAYQHEELVGAMKSHNYGLQYWIYSLVLHRHLQNLLEDYSYEQHFGGVMYLFVRGMSPEHPGSGVYFTVPDHNTLLQLGALLGEDDDER